MHNCAVSAVHKARKSQQHKRKNFLERELWDRGLPARQCGQDARDPSTAPPAESQRQQAEREKAAFQERVRFLEQAAKEQGLNL
jgi:hypothetical protein